MGVTIVISSPYEQGHDWTVSDSPVKHGLDLQANRCLGYVIGYAKVNELHSGVLFRQHYVFRLQVGVNDPDGAKVVQGFSQLKNINTSLFYDH